MNQGAVQFFDYATIMELAELFQYIFYITGVLSVGFGIWKMVEASQKGEQEGAKGVSAVAIGGMLMAIGPIIAYFSQSIMPDLGFDRFSQIARFENIEPDITTSTGGQSQDYLAFVNTLLNMVVLFGYWSVGKGLWLMKKTTDGASQHFDEGSMSGITHMLFGVFMVNVRPVVGFFLGTFLGFDPAIVQALVNSFY